MCIIIDTQFASDLFAHPTTEDHSPVIEWLFDPKKTGIVVYGGRLAVELHRIGSAARSIRVLEQAGRAVHFDDASINAEEQRLIGIGLCHSDDQHVIALARVSGARTVCSYDQGLHMDFKNQALINSPRGSIYQTCEHVDLLKHTSACRRPKRKKG